MRRGRALVDLQSPRRGCVVAVIQGGLSVMAAQELARRYTPVLSHGMYAHVGIHGPRGALDNLPELPAWERGPQSREAASRQSSTDDAAKPAIK